MVQEKVTRKELLEMHIGQTRIISLPDGGKVDSAKVTAKQMKDLKKGEWQVKPDYDSCAVSITRVK